MTLSGKQANSKKEPEHGSSGRMLEVLSSKLLTEK
jgi:hypothetical protein